MQVISNQGPKFEAARKLVQQKNKAFAKLPQHEQRIHIAKDVIAQIYAGKFKAFSGYFDISDFSGARDELEVADVVAQASSCQVCGIGSLFAGAVLNADKLKVFDLRPAGCTWPTMAEQRSKQTEYLQQWFSEDQLDLVEVFFEKWRPGTEYLWPESVKITLKTLRSSPIYLERSPKKRLVMIMENIISNRGFFNPFAGKHRTR